MENLWKRERGGLRYTERKSAERRISPLLSHSIKLQKIIIICLQFYLLTATAGATEYTIEPFPSDNLEEGIPLEITFIPYWQFLLWLVTVNMLVAVDLLYPKRIIFAISGYRIVNSGNVLNNPGRLSIYTYIKTKPGAYISEIGEKLGLDREIIKYHIKTLEAQNKIEAYREGGKTRFFENNFTYSDEEMKVISALQNITNQKIILEIFNGTCITNTALAHELRVSRATISWYMKKLREIGLITEIKEGRKTIYSINIVYENLVGKHIKHLQDSYNNRSM
jgi:predicted transcriptional regulator